MDSSTNSPQTQDKAASERSSTQKRVPLATRRVGVLHAAREVFSEYGYGGTSMRKIAEKAGINEAMLYRICANKEQLFHEAVALPLENAVAALTERSQSIALGNPDAENMKELSEDFVAKLLQTMQEIAPLLNAALLIGEEGGSTFFKQRLKPALDQLAEVIKNNLGHWAHRDFDVELLSRMIFGVSWYLAIDQRFSGRSKQDLTENAHQIVTMFFEGLKQAD